MTQTKGLSRKTSKGGFMTQTKGLSRKTSKGGFMTFLNSNHKSLILA